MKYVWTHGFSSEWWSAEPSAIIPRVEKGLECSIISVLGDLNLILSAMVYVVMDVGRKILNKVKAPLAPLATALFRGVLLTEHGAVLATRAACAEQCVLTARRGLWTPRPLLPCLLHDGTCLWAWIGRAEHTCVWQRSQRLWTWKFSPLRGTTSVSPWVNCSVPWYACVHFLQNGSQLHFFGVLPRKIDQRWRIVQFLPEPCNHTSPPGVLECFPSASRAGSPRSPSRGKV